MNDASSVFLLFLQAVQSEPSVSGNSPLLLLYLALQEPNYSLNNNKKKTTVTVDFSFKIFKGIVWNIDS